MQQEKLSYETPVLEEYGQVSEMTEMTMGTGGDGGGAGYTLT